MNNSRSFKGRRFGFGTRKQFHKGYRGMQKRRRSVFNSRTDRK